MAESPYLYRSPSGHSYWKSPLNLNRYTIKLGPRLTNGRGVSCQFQQKHQHLSILAA
jgi:hypothetical protein